MSRLLIVFVKHPELGKVKTRLAATLGKEKALSIYKQLLEHTLSICKTVQADVQIFYTDDVIQDDIWNDFPKKQQKRGDLGTRMFHALSQNEYEKKLIIGSDCFEINAEHIETAFQKLNETDAVIGPANDGGYYLLGLKEVPKEVFTDITWSSEKVLEQTIKKLNTLNKSHSLLPTLVDIDTESDLKQYKHYEQVISKDN